MPVSYQPSQQTRRKMRRFLTKLAETGKVKLAAEHAGWARTQAYEYRDKDAAFAAQWEQTQYQRRMMLGDQFRDALIDKALNDGNVHALIHLDRIYNREDYRASKPQPVDAGGPRFTILVPRPLAPDAIPEGDPARILEIMSQPGFSADDQDDTR